MGGTNGVKRLLKGDLLFREGDVSNAMYLIRSGSLRIFKRKGDSQIEIDTLRPGQILGEMAFLDGNPRSASAEAMNEVELVEISKSIYDNTMVQVPEWLKVLLKAIVARLRSTTTKLKNLESASTEMNYTDGKRNFTFLSPHDALKIATATLVVAALSKEDAPEGKKVKLASIERYANQVMGIPVTKVSSLVDVLKKANIMTGTDDGKELSVTDISMLEAFIQYVCDENLLEPTKRHDLSLRGFVVMAFVAKHMDEYPKDETGKAQVNIAAIKKTESEAGGREVFRMEEFDELVKFGYGTTVKVNSGEDQTSQIHVDSFKKTYRMQQVLSLLNALNDEKQKNALGYR